MRKAAVFAILAALALAGCMTAPPQVRTVQVKVAVPVPCRAEEPARPVYDTETVAPDAPIDVQSRAMRAEIERRAGYESQLRAAFRACKHLPE